MCFHLSGTLAKLGFRTLLIDADPQGSLSQGFFGSAQVEFLEDRQTLARVFDENSLPVSLEEIIQTTNFDEIDIVPSNQTLAKYNTPEPENSGLGQYAMQSLINGHNGYDFVLIDCPPNLYQCSWNAMLASDYVAIPVPPEDFGTQGLRTVHQAIERARRLNPRLRLLGQIITRFDSRLVIHRAYEGKLRQIYKKKVFSANVPEATAFKVSLACRKPVSFYSSRCKAAQQLDLLAHELISRANVETPNNKEVA